MSNIENVIERVFTGDPAGIPNFDKDYYYNPPISDRDEIYSRLLSKIDGVKNGMAAVRYVIIICDSKEEYEHSIRFFRDLIKNKQMKEVLLSKSLWTLWSVKIQKHKINIDEAIKKIDEESKNIEA